MPGRRRQGRLLNRAIAHTEISSPAAHGVFGGGFSTSQLCQGMPWRVVGEIVGEEAPGERDVDRGTRSCRAGSFDDVRVGLGQNSIGLPPETRPMARPTVGFASVYCTWIRWHTPVANVVPAHKSGKANLSDANHAPMPDRCTRCAGSA